MLHTLSLKELRPFLPKVVENIDGKLDRYIITKRGRPVVCMLSVEDFDALMETLDILADPKMMADIRQGEEDLRKGKTKSWRELKRSLAKL